MAESVLDIILRAKAEGQAAIDEMIAKQEEMNASVAKSGTAAEGATSSFGGLNTMLIGATVVGGGLLEVVKSSIEGYAKFGEEVLNFQRVSGMSAEQSSKMVDVFGQLGVSAEAADKAMFPLAK